MKNNKAFTLVELIVVVTILGILATIGFVSYAGYLGGVRDGNRTAQLVSMHDALVLYSTNKDLPEPDDKVTINNGSELMGYQGYVGATVQDKIEFLKGGKDPKDGTYFSYYLDSELREFQLMTYLEDSENLLIQGPLNSANAAVNYTKRTPTILGERLGIMVQKDTNTPLQEISGISNPLDLAAYTGDLTAYFKSNDSYSGNGAILVNKIKNIQNIAAGGNSLTVATYGIQDVNGQQYITYLKQDGTVKYLNTLVASTASPNFSTNPSATVTDAKQLTLRAGHACMIENDDEIGCWGTGNYGQLGNSQTGNFGSVIQYAVPTPIKGKKVVVGSNFTCAITLEGGVKCWGNIGGTINYSSSPTDVPELNNGVKDIQIGIDNVCALMDNGGVKCWGNNTYGKTGITGSTSGYTTTPTDVSGITSGATQISVGVNGACALISGGEIKCWGLGTSYELGGGNNSTSATPVTVTGLDRPAIQVTRGYNHACALLDNNGIQCWGDNSMYQIGIGANTTDAQAPTYAGGLSGSTPIAVYGGHKNTFVLFDDYSVKYWGLKNGYYGSSGNIYSATSSPTTVNIQ